jgi:hypothetical protein
MAPSSTNSDNLSTSTNIQIFPNPSLATVHLTIGLSYYSIKIYNATGGILTTNYNMTSADSISTKELQYGTYIIKITTHGESISKKLIVK